LSLFRTTLDNSGKPGTIVSLQLYDGDTQINPDTGPDQAPFGSKFVLNKSDQTKFAVGTKAVYVGTDDTTAPPDQNNNVVIELTKVGDAAGEVTAMAYGVRTNTNAILAGTDGGKLFLSDTGTAASLNPLPGYGGTAPVSVLFDPRTIKRFYATDASTVWRTADKGVNFVDLSPNLPANFTSPRGLEFVSQNGVNAIFVGGVNSAADLGNPLVVASSKSDPTGTLYNPFTLATAGAYFSRFGNGLPNAPIYALYYSEAADVLAVGTFGRGAFTLYDVTSYFPQATTLWFGKADNDSTPIASQLANGMDENGAAFNRGLEKYGAGTLTIGSGLTAGYKGATSVLAGFMVVDGSIEQSSNVAVSGGATLGGTGTVPQTVVNSAATLAPGNAANPTGALTVKNSLTLAAGSNYAVNVLGTNVSSTNVQGTASIAGGLTASYLGGVLAMHAPYTILNTTTGLAGTFASFSGNTFAATKGRTTYDSNNAYIVLDPNMIATIQQLSPTSNQTSVAQALDSALMNAANVPFGFNVLYSLGGAALTNALTQLSGELGASASLNTATQINNMFMQLLLNPFSGTPTGNPASGARPFAAEAALTPSAEQAYAAVTPKDARPPSRGEWSIWGQAFGGWNKTGGSAAAGSQDTSARTGGFAAGVDRRMGGDTTVGFALAGGGASWSLAMGGTGRSDIFQAGTYATRTFGSAYVAGALTYSLHATTTDRTISVAGTDQLTANFNAQTAGGRIETGYRFQTPVIAVTPFAALQGQYYYSPAYAERATSGSSTFALSYGARSVFSERTELGGRFDRSVALGDGRSLATRVQTAWAHDYGGASGVSPLFQSLPGSNFTVNGAQLPRDWALVTAGSELSFGNGFAFGVKLDGEFAARSTTYAATGTVRHSW
jgi:outer membrane autotransporter protein